jgi:hypothetical protein
MTLQERFGVWFGMLSTAVIFFLVLFVIVKFVKWAWCVSF